MSHISDPQRIGFLKHTVDVRDGHIVYTFQALTPGGAMAKALSYAEFLDRGSEAAK